MSTLVSQMEEEIQEQKGQSSMERGGDVHDPTSLQDRPACSEEGSNAEKLEPLNPLMIEDTLEVILDHLSFANLKEVRNVHPVWNKVATRLLTPRCRPITFHSRTGNGQGYTGMKRLNELLHTTTSSGFPCTKFHISIDQLQESDKIHNRKRLTGHEKQEIVVSFFRLVSPFVQHLGIEYHFGECLFPEGLPPPEEFHFPELTTLRFDLGDERLIRFRNPMARNVHTRFLINIVEQAPKLTEVRPGELASVGEDHYVNAVLRRIPEPNRRRLQKLKLMGQVSDQDLTEWLNQKVRRLRELQLVVHPLDAVSEKALADFLEAQSETLETLSMECAVERPFILQLPKCQKLKNLHVGATLDFLQIAFRNYSFPVLKRLVLDEQLDGFFKGKVTPMETVKELEIQSSLNNPDMVAEMARVLPNLKKLILWVHSDSLGAKDLEPLKNVKELVLQFSSLSGATSCDELLTGCSVRDIEQARWWAEASDWMFRILAWWKEAPLPILKGLKKLIIKGNSLDTQVGFSDVTCRFVLLKLPDLTFLDVDLSKSRVALAISPQVMADMRSKFIVCVKPEPDSGSEGLKWYDKLLDVTFIFLAVVNCFLGGCLIMRAITRATNDDEF